MARQLILHIGLSKTGSSSIQRVLAGQREALQARGVYMPVSPGWANHALLPASLVNNREHLWGFTPGTWEGMTVDGRLARFQREWDAEMAALPDWAERVLITAEQVGGLLRRQDEVYRLRDMLAPLFDPIKVIVYLRRQDQHSASAFSQWLRGGVLRPPRLPENPLKAHPEINYGALIDRFEAAFGRDAIAPRIFDRAELHGGDVVEDFLHAAGLDIPIPPDLDEKETNTSISGPGQALLMAMGQKLEAADPSGAWRDTPQWRRMADAVSEALPGRGWRPSRDEARAFMAEFADSNESVRARYFPARETLFRMNFDDLPESADFPQGAPVLEAALALLLHETAYGPQREARAAMAQAGLLRRLGDRTAQRAQLVRAVKAAPDLLPARLQLGELLLEDGDLLQAEEHLAAAIRLGAGDQRVQRLQRRVAQAQQKSGKPARHVKLQSWEAGQGAGNPAPGGTVPVS